MKVIFGVAVLLCLSQARILPPKASLSFKEKLAQETQRKQTLSSRANEEEKTTPLTVPKTKPTNDFEVVTEVTRMAADPSVTSRPHYINSSAFRTTTEPATTFVAKAPETSITSSTSPASDVVKGISAESLFPSEGEGDLHPRTKSEFLAPGIRPVEPIVRTSPQLEVVSVFAAPSERVAIGDYDYDALVFSHLHGDMSSFHAEFPFRDEYRTEHRPFGF